MMKTMKQLGAKLLMVWGLGVLACPSLMAQQSQAKPTSETRSDKRLKFAELGGEYIAQQLGLDKDKSERFVATFKELQRDLYALAPSLPRGNKSGQVSDKEIEEAIKLYFDKQEQILELRKRYYDKFRTFLSPQEVQKVYQFEREMMHRLSGKHHYGRHGKGDKAHRGDRKGQRRDGR